MGFDKAKYLDEDSEEVWVPVDGFPGYHVSNMGRVKSFRKDRSMGPVILRPSKTGRYRRATVTVYLDKKPHYKLVSRLVCAAFYGPAPVGYQAAHYDGNAENDKASNLRWASSYENHQDRYRHGTVIKGERHYAAKLKEAEVIEIRSIYSKAQETGKTLGVIASLASAYNCRPDRIEAIVYKRSWKCALPQQGD